MSLESQRVFQNLLSFVLLYNKSLSESQTLRFSGKQFHCSPQKQSLSVKCELRIVTEFMIFSL